MAFGLTATGFQRKTLAEIKTEIESSLKTFLGNDINLLPQEPLGQLVGIFSERETLLWELFELVYYSNFPDTAQDRVSLLNAVALTGISALPATSSTVVVRIFGTLNTSVPANFLVAVTGSNERLFRSLNSGVINSTINEIQKIEFSSVPTVGDFSLTFSGQTTTLLAFNSTNSQIQNALNALSNLSSVVVSGNFLNGFLVSFEGVDGAQSQPLMIVSTNTLNDGVGAVSVQITRDTKGFAAHVDLNFIAQETGPIVALSGSITTIVNATFGITSVINLNDAIVGRGEETDAQIRLRREQQLQRKGTASIEGIRAALINLANVSEAIVIENDQNVIDSEGRPPKSFEAFVEGGAQLEIANIIWESKAAGIETFGDITQIVQDSQGFNQTIKFSRPTKVLIFMTINIEKNLTITEGSVYPINGDELVEAAVLNYASTLKIGNDVVLNRFFTPINTVPGVVGIEIFVGLSANPTGTSNIAISRTSLAVFDSTRIIVVS